MKSGKKMHIFTIFSQQILSDKLLLFVISEAKNNFSSRFKLEPNNLTPRICYFLC